MLARIALVVVAGWIAACGGRTTPAPEPVAANEVEETGCMAYLLQILPYSTGAGYQEARQLFADAGKLYFDKRYREAEIGFRHAADVFGSTYKTERDVACYNASAARQMSAEGCAGEAPSIANGCP